jgi:hypothetical protein
MATKAAVIPEQEAPKYRFPLRDDQNKAGRMLAMFLAHYATSDKRGQAQVRFDVYQTIHERVGEKGKFVTLPVFVSRIYVQRDIDTDDTLPGRPYLLVEETRGEVMEDDIVMVTKVEIDGKGRPNRDRPHSLKLDELMFKAGESYEFLVGM